MDNSPCCYLLQKGNGLPIRSWYVTLLIIYRLGDDIEDHELIKITKVLEKLAQKYDVRKYIRRFVKTDYSNNLDFIGRTLSIIFYRFQKSKLHFKLKWKVYEINARVDLREDRKARGLNPYLKVPNSFIIMSR